MPQFAVTPERSKILARIPDYAVELVPLGQTVTVTINDQQVARSEKALLVRETRHEDVYYLPGSDVDMALFTPTEHSTFCPFKGHASYWNLNPGGGLLENIVWSYDSPDTEVAGLRGYLSFYTDRASIVIGP